MCLGEFLESLSPLFHGDLTGLQVSSVCTYLLVSIMMFLNSSVMAPPSEYICLSIGVLAAHNRIDLVPAVLLAAFSNLAGTYIWYQVGRYHKEHSRTIATDGVAHDGSMVEKIKHLYTGKLVAIERLYLEHGVLVVFLLRNVPVLRSIASYPAGRVRMRLYSFLVASILGIMVWVVLWASLGLGLGVLALTYKWQIGLVAGLVSLLVLKLALSRLGASVLGSKRKL